MLWIFQSLVDDQGLDAIQRSATACQRAVEEERWEDATRLWSTTESVVMYRTHFVDFYNILKFNVPGGSRRGSGVTLCSWRVDLLMRIYYPHLANVPADVNSHCRMGPSWEYEKGCTCSLTKSLARARNGKLVALVYSIFTACLVSFQRLKVSNHWGINQT